MDEGLRRCLEHWCHHNVRENPPHSLNAPKKYNEENKEEETDPELARLAEMSWTDFWREIVRFH